MNIKFRTRNGLALISVLLISLMISSVVAAAPLLENQEAELTGEVIAIDPESSTFQLAIENELGELEVYTVQVGEDFNYNTLNVGDLVEVKGMFNDEGILVLSEYKIEERAADGEQEQDRDGENYFCTSSDDKHPVAKKMAETYGVSYEEIMVWFCGETQVGLGQVMLALQTAALTGQSADTYLQGRLEGKGWGQLWQEADVIGKPDKQTPPGQIMREDQTGKLEDKLPPGLLKGQFECDEDEEECESFPYGGLGGFGGDWVPPGLLRNR